MGCNINSYNTGLQPICLPIAQFEPNEITCPQINTQPIENELCDLLPTITSLPDYLINLPFLMLFIVSLPSSFLYCMAYQFLVNADNVYTFLIYYILYPFVDFITLPFLYFIIGFNNGVLQQFDLPSQTYGFLDACFFSNIIKEVYNILGDVFYVIGYGIGFFSSLLIKFVNLLIDTICYILFFTLCINIGFCISFTIPVINYTTPPIGTCTGTCIQPFSFLQTFVKGILNCACALGNCPTVALNLTLDLNCSPSCSNQTDINPPCLQYTLNPIQPLNTTFTQPKIIPQSNEQSIPQNSEQSTPQNSEQSSPQNSEQTSPQNSEQLSSENTEQNYPQNSEQSSPQNSEQSSPQNSEQTNNPCYVVNELYYCQECLSENENCDLCYEVLNTIKENGCSFPCCNYPCLISNACYECSENYSECYNCSEQYHDNACMICNTLVNSCYANQNYVELPCYSEFVSELKSCFETYNSEICNEANSEYNYCKIIKAYTLCPPTISSESEYY
jgi:hypothetical protein